MTTASIEAQYKSYQLAQYAVQEFEDLICNRIIDNVKEIALLCGIAKEENIGFWIDDLQFSKYDGTIIVHYSWDYNTYNDCAAIVFNTVFNHQVPDYFGTFKSIFDDNLAKTFAREIDNARLEINELRSATEKEQNIKEHKKRERERKQYEKLKAQFEK